MENKSIHHFDIFTSEGYSSVQQFISKYPFHVKAKRCGVGVTQWLVSCMSNADIQFVFSSIDDASLCGNDPYFVDCLKIQKDEQLHSQESLSNRPIDSVYNVALEVNDTQKFYDRMNNNNVTVVKDFKTIEDEHGSIDLFTIKSVVGNVFHTLLNSKDYHGVFLPGFELVSESLQSNPHTDDEGKISHIDHFTFACDVGTSTKIIDWYEKHFFMKRFILNRDETENEGFVISGTDIGLRMKALEYWKCAELGLAAGEGCPARGFKIVIAEALANQGPNQIATFLSEHQGPGIQHIGLHTCDMVGTVRSLKARGVEFAEPPDTYYTEVGRRQDILDMGLGLEELRGLGILIDTEEGDQGTRYLLQKFTKPLFGRDTFFLEVIQRVGATGFGSGNITALWRSIQAYMNHKARTEGSV